MTGDRTARPETLARYGVDADAYALYEVALRRPGSTAAELAVAAGKDPAVVEELLLRLVRAGLLPAAAALPGARVLPDAPAGVIATLLSEVVADLTAHAASFLTHLENGRVMGAAMVEAERALRTSRPDDDQWAVEHLDLGRWLSDAAANDSGSELMVCAPSPDAAKDLVPVFQTRESVRLLLSVRCTPSDIDALTAARPGAEPSIRLDDGLPGWFAVDGPTVTVPARWGQEALHPGSPLIRIDARGAAGLLRTLFDALWPSASRWPQPAPGTTRHVLTLLAHGLTDGDIAQQTGLSLRAVRARVANALEELDAATRYQAGYEAARRGWLE